MADKKTCYIIGPIGDPDTEERKWADFVRDNIVEPAVTASGYEAPARADDPDKDLIMFDIIQQMFEADLVIVDLTDYNPNVFYELGIRHCAQKPAIHLIRTGQPPPFDLGGNKAIFVDDKHLTVTKAISDIQGRIKAIENDPKQFYSQVQQHIQYKQLELFKRSQTGKDKVFADTLSTVAQSIRLLMGMTEELHKELVLKPRQPSYRPLYRSAEQTPGVELPKMTKVQGVVNVTKDANDLITKVTLVTKDKVVYNVVLNMKGLNLGKEMADKEVEVEGTVSKRADQQWIRVQSYKQVEKTPPTPPKAE